MRIAFGLIAVSLMLVSGCEPKESESDISTAGENVLMDGPPPATVDVHEHPSEGPHQGTLVELGKEEFHAEVVHSGDSVTVYILDEHAENLVPIEAKELMINAIDNGMPKQFKLVATPEANELASKSSKFAIADAELSRVLDIHSASPKLSVTINGKAYRGVIAHEHKN